MIVWNSLQMLGKCSGFEMDFTAPKERRSRYDEPGKGRWRPFERSAVLSCPRCGMLLSLLKDFQIQEDGKVEPHVRCTASRDCRFIANVKLEGWDANRDPDNPQSALGDL